MNKIKVKDHNESEKNLNNKLNIKRKKAQKSHKIWKATREIKQYKVLRI